MNARKRLVLDTNLVVSAVIFPGSTPRRVLLAAQAHAMLASQATLLELVEVIERPMWDRYVDRRLRSRLISEYMAACEMVSVISTIQACRHPKDDKFLELAVDGQADLILTGDQDLLVLHPFRGIGIQTPAQFLAQ